MGLFCRCSWKTEQATKIYASYSLKRICGARKESALYAGMSCQNLRKDWLFFWVAHASRVLAIAFSPSRTFLNPVNPQRVGNCTKDRFGATPKSARERGALPRVTRTQHSSCSDRCYV